jgi:hypothetical protein
MILMRKEKFSTLCCGVSLHKKSMDACMLMMLMMQIHSSHSSVSSISMLHWARLDWISSHTPHAEEFFHVGMWNWGVLQYTATATTTYSGSNSSNTTTYLAS